MTPTTLDRSGCAAHRHGTMSAYHRYGCRCPDAKHDRYIYWKHRRTGHPQPRRLPATDTHQRLRALQANGWTLRHIATMLGVDHSTPGKWLTHPQVMATTAHKVEHLYNQLAHQPGPSNLVRRYAQTHGWLTPQDWNDWGNTPDPTPDQVICQVAIERVLSHQATIHTLHPHEQTHLFNQLRQQGLSDEQIRYRLRLSPGLTARLARQHNQQQETPA